MRLPVLAVLLALIACGRPEPEPTGARQLEPLASARAVEPPTASPTDRYVVFARDKLLWAVVPDGSPAIPLAISEGPRYGSGISTFGWQQPTMSPDGQTLAHLVDGELRLTVLPSLETVGIAGLSGPLLIGPWSPSGRALFVVSDQPGPFELRTTHVVDVAEGTATVMELADKIPQWGIDDDHVMLWHAFDGSAGVAWATVPELEPYVRMLGLPNPIGRTIADARAGYLVGRSPGKVWISEVGEALDEAGKPRDLLAVSDRFMGDVRLAPDGRHVGLCVGHPTDPKFDLPGELVVVSTSGGEPTALTECGPSWSLYWYDDRHIVLGGGGAVYGVGIDRELQVIAENARLVPQRRRGIRQ